MSGQGQTFMPTQLELMEFFGVAPVEEAPEDGFWCWEVEDSYGVRLRFSVNALQKSVQTSVMINRRVVAVVSHENAERLWLTDESGRHELLGSFHGGSERTEMRVVVCGGVACVWSTLAS